MKKRKGNKGKGQSAAFDDWDSVRATKGQGGGGSLAPVVAGLVAVALLAAAYYYQPTAGDQAPDIGEGDLATVRVCHHMLRLLSDCSTRTNYLQMCFAR